jgi:transcriptional regulator with XRE-family HTH domain
MNRVGQALRTLREEMGFTTRDVQAASAGLARKYRNDRYLIPISRLCEFEKRDATPSIYRLYSLAVIYRRDLDHLLRLYSIGSDDSGCELQASSCVLHQREASAIVAHAQDLAITQEIAFDPRKTRYLGQMMSSISDGLPFSYLQQFASSSCAYGYVGSEDWTMYPLLPPASLVQIDESRNHVLSGAWGSEYERPIYFVEMRGQHACCWCTVGRDFIILQPHPSSSVAPRVLQPHDAEVLGQVVGAALMFGQRHPKTPPK